MKNLLLAVIFALFGVFLGAHSALAISAEDVVKKSQEAFLYAGKDFSARVKMKLTSKSGGEREREMTMLRMNVPGGADQLYYMYFHKPADVKKMAFLVKKYPKKDDDRWLFIPAINMTRRIAAQDKRSSFVGSDFTYEDISGRDADDDRHEHVREEKVGNRDALVVKSTPKGTDTDYGYKLSWIDKSNFLLLKEEYYDKRTALYRVFTAVEIKDISGHPTVVKRAMKNLETGHSTEVEFSEVAYDSRMDESIFTERYLKQPPKQWVE